MAEKNKPVLKIDWATHEAAKYACENWHYSKCLPVGKIVKVGAWEDGKFIGVVLFGRGATPNLGKPYNLSQTQCCELVRVAMTKHKTEISKIVAFALKFFKKNNPNMELVISFADTSQGHHGGIYQAGNWVYNGQGEGAYFYKINGRITHPRSIGAAGYKQNLDGAKQLDRNAERVYIPGKHRYLMPLNKEISPQIKKLSKPYPKRVKPSSEAPGDQPGEGGAEPTHTLQIKKGEK